MNKKDLIEALIKVLSTRKEASDAIENIFSSMKNALLKKEKVVISGFGSFNVRLSPARKCRIPKTNKYVSVPARPKIRFKPSKELFYKPVIKSLPLIPASRFSPATTAPIAILTFSAVFSPIKILNSLLI